MPSQVDIYQVRKELDGYFMKFGPVPGQVDNNRVRKDLDTYFMKFGPVSGQVDNYQVRFGRILYEILFTKFAKIWTHI